MVRYWNSELFCLAACNKKFQRASARPYAYAASANANKARWARDSQARTRLVDSLFCSTCSLGNNAFSALRYVISVALHYSMLHRLVIFSAPGTIAHGSIRLPPRSLASSRGCSLANAIRVHKSLALSQLDIVYFLQYQSACFVKSIDLEFRWACHMDTMRYFNP